MSISEAVRRSPGEVRGAGGDSGWRCALPSRKGRKAKVWSSVSRREEFFFSPLPFRQELGAKFFIPTFLRMTWQMCKPGAGAGRAPGAD